MKTFRTKAGPFSERPYYEDEDIESICLEELQAVGLLPPRPEPIRIDRFIEKRFRVTPEYEDLGDGVLGLTVFGADGVKRIVVARALEEEDTQAASRRVSSTLAHEAGHGLLHGQLFATTAEKRPLFGDYSDPQAPKVLCRDVPMNSRFPSPGYDGRWWEYQANRVIGALLLPRPLVQKALESFLVTSGSFGMSVLDGERREEAARHLRDVFDVNPVVARIRLNGLYRAGGAGGEMQLRL